MADRRLSHGEIADLAKKRRHVKIYEARRSTMKWLSIIVIIAVITLVLLHIVPPLFSRLDIVDTTYRPRDVERQYHQIQKMREGEPDKTQKGNWQQIK